MAGAPPPLEQRVDEWCDRRALGEHDQAAEHDHHDQNRQQPELLALAHEGPELDDYGAHFACDPFDIRTGCASIAAAAPAACGRSSSCWRCCRASAAGNPCRTL